MRIHPSIAQSLRLKKWETNENFSMAASLLTAKIPRYSIANTKLNSTTYDNIKFFIVQYLCRDIFLGQDLQEQMKG